MPDGALVPVVPQSDLQEVEGLALHFLKSGMFPSLNTIHQTVVKIMAGRELGLGPFASIDGFDIIKGRISPSGNLTASLVRDSRRYDYRIKKLNNQGCTLAFYFKKSDNTLGEHLGDYSFTEADAKTAGLANGENYKKYPQAMYFNRAMTAGQKLFCPDVFSGTKVYVPEEIGGLISPVDVETNGSEVASPPEGNPDVTSYFRLLEEKKISPEDLVKDLEGWDLQELQGPTPDQARALLKLLRFHKLTAKV